MIFQPGETVILQVTVRDLDGVLVTLAVLPTIRLEDPATGVKLEDVDMTPDSAGVYHTDYDLLANAKVGTWNAEVTAVNGTRVTIQGFTFRVIARTT